MKKSTLALFVFINVMAYGQPNDSTKNFKLYPLEKVTQTMKYDNEQTFESGSERSTLLIFDESIRHCLLTVKLTEYKSGTQVSVDTIFSDLLIDEETGLQSFEDPAMLFSLYRKPYQKNSQVWGFRAPNSFKTKFITLYESIERYQVVAIPQNYLNNTITVGTFFPLLIITTPDKTNNYPFFNLKSEDKSDPAKWNRTYGLGHTYLVELLITPTTLKKQSTTQTLNSM